MADNSFLLLASFANALAHKIRTPLTVVTNELSFLASQGHDCARAVQRSKDIAHILRTATSLGSANINETEIDLGQCLTKIFPGLESASLRGAAFKIITDTMHLEATLRLVKILLNDLSANDESADKDEFAPSFDVVFNEAQLSFACTLHDPVSVKGEFDSLTKLFSQNLHLDLIEAPLIDAGAQSCGMKILAQLVDGKFSLKGTWKTQ